VSLGHVTPGRSGERVLQALASKGVETDGVRLLKKRLR
jgi:hypothetical protein